METIQIWEYQKLELDKIIKHENLFTYDEVISFLIGMYSKLREIEILMVKDKENAD